MLSGTALVSPRPFRWPSRHPSWAANPDGIASYLNIFGTPTLTVPYGCASAYQNSAWYDPMGWNGFYEFIEDEDYDVTEIEGIVSAVYPNPTHGVVRIEAEDIRNISIYGISGQKVYEGAASGDAFEYDFGKHKAGIYMIVVETTKGVETKRVTVL